MTLTDSARLDTGDTFPTLTFALPDGKRLRVPEELDHDFQVILFYRGHWCSYCLTQLTSFQSGLAKLEAEGIGVLAASVDDEEHAAGTIEKLNLTFPVAHGLPVVETAQAIGAFYESSPARTAPFLHSTGFLLGPDRTIRVAVYSSGAIGRLTWQDVLGMVEHIRSR